MGLKTGIVGASGAAGAELARLLVVHPELEVTHLYAHSQAGKHYGETQPGIPSLKHLQLREVNLTELADLDVVFVALPHGQSAALTNALAQIPGHPLIVDCGADHRLRDQSAWEHYYRSPYSQAWAYGMPELATANELQNRHRAEAATTPLTKSRELLQHTRTIAVPGCNVTAVTLALMPAIAHQVVNPYHITATAAVGYSGAGRNPKPHLMAINALNNLAPYSAVGAHRHIPEIEQNLQWAAPDENGPQPMHVDFTPILAPTSRGILAVVNAPLAPHLAERAHSNPEDVTHLLAQAYRSAYDPEPLIDFSDDFPTTQAVLGTGRAIIWAGINLAAGTVTTMAAIDNLGKGTASAAIQSANLALGLDELTAIPTVGVTP